VVAEQGRAIRVAGFVAVGGRGEDTGVDRHTAQRQMP
jgi:hypothetical protein